MFSSQLNMMPSDTITENTEMQHFEINIIQQCCSLGHDLLKSLFEYRYPQIYIF
jgi:hypothetical protein